MRSLVKTIGTNVLRGVTRNVSLGARGLARAAVARGEGDFGYWLSAAAVGAAAAATLAVADVTYSSSIEDVVNDPEHPLNLCGVRREDLPDFTKADIEGHDSLEKGMWVSFRDGVYNITDFVAAHPGGEARIVQAAGGPLEPFWSIFQQHLTKPATYNVAQHLESLRIGNVAPGEDMLEGINMNDSGEPARSPLLKQHTTAPCNAEAPMGVIQHDFLTPVPLHYVRHHHPVPIIDREEYELRLDVAASESDPFWEALERNHNLDEEARKLLLKDRRSNGYVLHKYSFGELLSHFKTHEIDVTLMCAGNRRSGLNAVKQTQGLGWDCGAISTGRYRGIKLCDVLKSVGITEDGPFDPDQYHVQFIAADMPYDASVPLWKALSPRHDILLAYEQNDSPMSPDHGAPVRLIVPGCVGARSVKWITGVRLARKPSPSPWQSGSPYRLWGPYVDDLSGKDPEEAAPVNELPVQSAITSPTPNSRVKVEGAASDGTVEVEACGYAFSGGGRKIVRVDVSSDGGKTWHPADLEEGGDQPYGRSWAWTLWSAVIPTEVKEGKASAEIVVKAVDEAANSQPGDPAGIWNVRGILNNSWHRVPVEVEVVEED
jgi:sulfite oxidase